MSLGHSYFGQPDSRDIWNQHSIEEPTVPSYMKHQRKSANSCFKAHHISQNGSVRFSNSPCNTTSYPFPLAYSSSSKHSLHHINSLEKHVPIPPQNVVSLSRAVLELHNPEDNYESGNYDDFQESVDGVSSDLQQDLEDITSSTSSPDTSEPNSPCAPSLLFSFDGDSQFISQPKKTKQKSRANSDAHIEKTEQQNVEDKSSYDSGYDISPSESGSDTSIICQEQTRRVDALLHPYLLDTQILGATHPRASTDPIARDALYKSNHFDYYSHRPSAPSSRSVNMLTRSVPLAIPTHPTPSTAAHTNNRISTKARKNHPTRFLRSASEASADVLGCNQDDREHCEGLIIAQSVAGGIFHLEL